MKRLTLKQMCVYSNTKTPPPSAVIEDIMAPQVHHVHCRVGYEEGPQVPDPRTEQWMPYTEVR